jgi:hypothetical protein
MAWVFFAVCGQRRRTGLQQDFLRRDYCHMMTAHRHEAPMSSAKGLRQAGYFDCPGGGQIVVARTTAFIGRLRGLTILERC